MMSLLLASVLLILFPTGMTRVQRDGPEFQKFAPWYHPRTDLLPLAPGPAHSQPVDLASCTKECVTVTDCPVDQSCFGATMARPGCCLPALAPNATGCVSDEQCRRACESTVCDFSQNPSRCLCEPGTHFLFEKCWKRCPPFAHPQPETDEKGFSYCILKVKEAVGKLFMRRDKRMVAKNAFC